jgi:hypothetical protein
MAMNWFNILKAPPFTVDEFHEIVPLDQPNKQIKHWDAEKLFKDKIDPLLIDARREGYKHIRFNSEEVLGMHRDKAFPLLVGWYPKFKITVYDWNDDMIDIHWENKDSYVGGEG